MEENEGIKKVVSISKNELAQLPAEEYHNGLVLVDHENDIDYAAEMLRKADIIGFDTETKPSFKRGQHHQVSLLQLSTRTECYLILLNKVGMPDSIKNILEDENKLKIGLSIHDDFLNLRKLCKIEPKGFIELQEFVKEFNIADNSLSRIYAILFNKRISKGQRLTNWEADELTSFQKEYAALDALACINIYDYLFNGNFKDSDSPYFRVPVDPNQNNNTIQKEESVIKDDKSQTTPVTKKRRPRRRSRTINKRTPKTATQRRDRNSNGIYN